MTDKVRVRFAPSPTGPMHIGGLRTAIFNWLFARHHGGTFILRIEDTDQSRYVPGAVDLIYNAFDWIGMDIDESPRHGGDFGPYVQSERLSLYHEWAKWLVENDKAYYDYTTSEELEIINDQRKRQGLPPGYDRRGRDLTEAERTRLKAEGRPEVVRFKMPLYGETVVTDMMRGEVRFNNTTLQDLVLLKSDGYPTYHLANIVDDHFMNITHILRANEWLASAPIHAQLYEAFGWEMPQIAHLPVLLNPNGEGKLSKRSVGFDASGKRVPVLVQEYQELGYLPEATMNFLTNIGWTFGDGVEMFEVEDAIKRFDIKGVNPSNSAYPIDKLNWLNGKYIREKLDEADLAKRLRPILEAAGLVVDEEKLVGIVPAIKSRIERLTDAIDMAGFIFRTDFTPASAEAHIEKQMTAENTLKALELSLALLEELEPFEPSQLEAPMRQLAKDHGFKAGQLFGTLRTSISAQQVAPPLFDTMVVIGKETTLQRIRQSIEIMKQIIN